MRSPSTWCGGGQCGVSVVLQEPRAADRQIVERIYPQQVIADRSHIGSVQQYAEREFALNSELKL